MRGLLLYTEANQKLRGSEAMPWRKGAMTLMNASQGRVRCCCRSESRTNHHTRKRQTYSQVNVKAVR